MDLACMAGQILLENGAELSRVEDTMNRIADHYGVETRQFYLLTNGIFSTSGGRYAKVNPIPVKTAMNLMGLPSGPLYISFPFLIQVPDGCPSPNISKKSV